MEMPLCLVETMTWLWKVAVLLLLLLLFLFLLLVVSSLVESFSVTEQSVWKRQSVWQPVWQ